MKATLEYHLPEDETEFKWARDGYKRWSELKAIRVLVLGYICGESTLSADEILQVLLAEYIPKDLDD